MQVRRFQVLAGKHHSANGTVYKQGDVLESTRRLDVLFKNKFIEVSSLVAVTREPDPDGLPPPDYRRPETGEGSTAELEADNQRLREELKKAIEKIAELEDRIAATAEEEDDVPSPKKTAKKGKNKKEKDPLSDEF